MKRTTERTMRIFQECNSRNLDVCKEQTRMQDARINAWLELGSTNLRTKRR
jgi:hypothetical protein